VGQGIQLRQWVADFFNKPWKEGCAEAQSLAQFEHTFEGYAEGTGSDTPGGGGFVSTASDVAEQSPVEVARVAWTQLHTAIAVLRDLEMTEIPGEVTQEFLVESRAVRASLESVDLRLLQRFDHAQSWRADGFMTAASCVRTRLKMSHGEVRERVHTARLLDRMPMMAQALATGDISYAHLRTVSRAADRNPSRRVSLDQADELLARSARKLNPTDLNRVVHRWVHAVDPEAIAGREQALHEQRTASVCSTFDGAVDVRALLGPEDGVVLITALDARVAASYRDAVARDGLDTRCPGQRRADALVDIAAHYLAHADLPEVGGSRPQVQVIVALETLQAARGARGVEPGTLVGVGDVSADAARRITCDASIVRVVLDPDGHPLDIGRSTRTIPTGIRTALDRRDGGCRFPGCERKVAFCDGHHIQHWSHGGPTSLSNLIHLCRHHHRLVHDHGYQIHGRPDTALTFMTPDGRTLHDPLPVPRGSLPLHDP